MDSQIICDLCHKGHDSELEWNEIHSVRSRPLNRQINAHQLCEESWCKICGKFPICPCCCEHED